MQAELVEKIEELQRQLHANPELSGEEEGTRARLAAFLRQNTTLQVVDTGSVLFAVNEEGAAKTLCLRADMDAVCNSAGQPFHGCGHDGHSAALAGAALYLQQLRQSGAGCGKNVLLLWQPAEETGAGAAEALKTLQATYKGGIDAIYGCHNIPGYPLGQVLVREGVFACASKGMTIHLTGRQSHAAYPEQGVSPGPLMGEVLQRLQGWCQLPQYSGLVLASLVGLRAGSHNFGISAGEGELNLTLRAECLADLLLLQKTIENTVEALAKKQGIAVDLSYMDEFPDTVNDAALTAGLGQVLAAAGISTATLAQPMRWSEDFGWYLKQTPGVYFGGGCRAKHPRPAHRWVCIPAGPAGAHGTYLVCPAGRGCAAGVIE